MHADVNSLSLRAKLGRPTPAACRKPIAALAWLCAQACMRRAGVAVWLPDQSWQLKVKTEESMSVCSCLRRHSLNNFRAIVYSLGVWGLVKIYCETDH